MSDIANDVLAAQQDRNKLNQLISDYLPFIKKQLSNRFLMQKQLQIKRAKP